MEGKMEHSFLAKLRRDPRYRSPDRVSSPDLLYPPFRTIVERIVLQAKAKGQEFVIFETYRSTERQTQLFREGRTKLRNVGVHHYGLAADLVRKVDGRLTWEADYTLLGQLAKARGLIWGGDWKTFPDSVHLQYIPVRDQARLLRGEWFPS